MTPKLRLNRWLAQVGVASRRKADELIREGRVEIDGVTVTELGTKIDPAHARVSVDGVPLDRPAARKLYFLLYKPKQVVTTLSDPEGRRTIRDYFPVNERLFPVGRLDYDAEGLLLLTNDGDLAQHLAHPRYEVPKTYLVKVKGKPDAETVAKLRRGVRLEDGFAKPKEAILERETREHTWFRLVVAEGRNRLIKRIWQRLGHPVLKLTRVKFGSLELGDLRPGQSRPLRRAEVLQLEKVSSASSRTSSRA